MDLEVEVDVEGLRAPGRRAHGDDHGFPRNALREDALLIGRARRQVLETLVHLPDHVPHLGDHPAHSGLIAGLHLLLVGELFGPFCDSGQILERP